MFWISIKGILHPKMIILIMIRSYLSLSNGRPVTVPLTSKHCWGPEKYEKHRQGSPSAGSGSIWILWSDENIFWTQRILFLNNFFSTIRLLSVSPHHRSGILNITHRTHAAYALLHPPRTQECVFYVYLRFDLNENSAFLPGKGTVTRLPVFI